MDLSRAKETLINAMHYAAYRETGTSLLVSDRNLLFGSEHFRLEEGREPHPGLSPWGSGDEFLAKCAQLLGWASTLNRSAAFADALKIVKQAGGFLADVIYRAEKDGALKND